MNINRAGKDSNSVPVRDIPLGECFTFAGELNDSVWMRIDLGRWADKGTPPVIDAIKLNDGGVCAFVPDRQVTPLDVVAQIQEEVA